MEKELNYKKLYERQRELCFQYRKDYYLTLIELQELKGKEVFSMEAAIRVAIQTIEKKNKQAAAQKFYLR